MVPIPGTKRRKYLDENLDAINVKLRSDDFSELNVLAALTSGDRYPAQVAKLVDQSS
jgi:aryl-alcohol dehydrogenase-like predicted oxidoreductase